MVCSQTHTEENIVLQDDRVLALRTETEVAGAGWLRCGDSVSCWEGCRGVPLLVSGHQQHGPLVEYVVMLGPEVATN